MMDYGAEYWARMDGGAGVQDSVMWSDLAFIVHHLFAQGPRGEDLAPLKRHIDVGCGPGYMVRHMRKRGFESFGVDLSEYALSIAPENIRQYLYPFDLSWVDDTHFGHDAFDIVTSFETFEHIHAKETDRAIGHVRNLLRSGGAALLNICVAGQPGWDTDPTHVNVIERAWWEEKFAQHGFLRDRDVERRLKEFHLFTNYLGTFVVRKP